MTPIGSDKLEWEGSKYYNEINRHTYKRDLDENRKMDDSNETGSEDKMKFEGDEL